MWPVDGRRWRLGRMNTRGTLGADGAVGGNEVSVGGNQELGVGYRGSRVRSGREDINEHGSYCIYGTLRWDGGSGSGRIDRSVGERILGRTED